jgi:hypothetical protein
MPNEPFALDLESVIRILTKASKAHGAEYPCVCRLAVFPWRNRVFDWGSVGGKCIK